MQSSRLYSVLNICGTQFSIVAVQSLLTSSSTAEWHPYAKHPHTQQSHPHASSHARSARAATSVTSVEAASWHAHHSLHTLHLSWCTSAPGSPANHSGSCCHKARLPQGGPRSDGPLPLMNKQGGAQRIALFSRFPLSVLSQDPRTLVAPLQQDACCSRRPCSSSLPKINPRTMSLR